MDSATENIPPPGKGEKVV